MQNQADHGLVKGKGKGFSIPAAHLYPMIYIAMQRSTCPEFAIKRASQKLIVMQQSHVTLVLSLTMFTACSVPSRSTFTLRRSIVFYGTVTMVITGGRGYYAGRSS